MVLPLRDAGLGFFPSGQPRNTTKQNQAEGTMTLTPLFASRRIYVLPVVCISGPATRQLLPHDNKGRLNFLIQLGSHLSNVHLKFLFLFEWDDLCFGNKFERGCRECLRVDGVYTSVRICVQHSVISEPLLPFWKTPSYSECPIIHSDTVLARPNAGIIQIYENCPRSLFLPPKCDLVRTIITASCLWQVLMRGYYAHENGGK